MCAPVRSKRRSPLMGELSWIVVFAYTSAWPSWPRYTCRKTPDMLVYSLLCNVKEKESQRNIIFGLQIKRKSNRPRKRMAVEVAVNVITAESNLIWNTGRHLRLKWFPGIQTLMLPHVDGISRGFRASFPEASHLIAVNRMENQFPHYGMHSTHNGIMGW